MQVLREEAVKTCKRGHPLTPENVYVRSSGFGECRACALDRYYRRKSSETRKNFRCEICGKEIWVQPSTLGKRRFCSYACQNQAPDIRQRLRDREGVKNPRFKDGKRAGDNIRGWSVLLKGDDCCRVCGSARGLHLHHVIPRSKSRAARRDLRNGLTLCSSCHAKWHRHSLVIHRDVFTQEEWGYISSVQIIGQRIEAWLDDHYPPAT